jgi:hypothetical protein
LGSVKVSMANRPPRPLGPGRCGGGDRVVGIGRVSDRQCRELLA